MFHLIRVRYGPGVISGDLAFKIMASLDARRLDTSFHLIDKENPSTAMDWSGILARFVLCPNQGSCHPGLETSVDIHRS